MRNKTLIGVDIVEFARVERMKQEPFASRILSDQEKAIYDKMEHPRRRLEFLAGRFALKEAYTKANRAFDTKLNMNEVTILWDDEGAPVLRSPYRPQDEVQVTLSHSEHYVVAFCMIIRGD